jgi:hypothetical protein
MSTDSRTERLFVFADPAIKAELVGSDTSVADLLKRDGQPVSAGTAADPATDPGVREKEPVSLLIGTAAVILALTPVVSRVVSTFVRRPVVVTEMVCVPLEDSKGKIVRDNAGNPIMTWVERKRLIESSRKEQTADALQLQGPLGLKISYQSKHSGAT